MRKKMKETRLKNKENEYENEENGGRGNKKWGMKILK